VIALDDIDRGLIHALHLDARAGFTKISEVLGTSTQTVARRYQRLRAEAGLRVAGLTEPHRVSRQTWIVRLGATPRAAQEIAQALARRSDTSWVQLTSGGTEIVAIVQTGAGDAQSLLLRDVPRTSGVTAVSAHYLLHLYLGGITAWRGRVDALDAGQQAAIRPAAPSRPGRVTLDDTDQRLLAALRRDGRASYADLATATGWSASTVARRVEDLRDRGVLFFDVEVDDTLLGVTTKALLWMSVRPAHLDQVATTLAGHPELAVVAATTGPTNLLATVLSPDPAALHHYLTTRLSMTAVTSIETAPVLRVLKGIVKRMVR
jgi:DNA-binding Lrp family transcriptional regulator